MPCFGPNTRRRIRRADAKHARRGVASVLSMMFLVMFGSLAIAMAVASQGNVRTAHTHLHVMKAQGAAETGLAIAEQHLADAISRFVVEKGTVDSGFATRLWSGTTTSGDGRVEVVAAPSGRADQVQTRGIADALLNAHYADANIVRVSGYPTTADTFAPAGDVDTSVFRDEDWVRTPLVAIDDDADRSGAMPAAYQITYAPLASGTGVRIIVTGFSSIGAGGTAYHGASGGYAGFGGAGGLAGGRPVTRVVQQDYSIVKRPGHVILSPSRILIGKNVHVEGELGARFDDVAQENGDPMTIKSDFFGLDAQLDTRLRRFFDALQNSDIDGDNRLRVNHPSEGAALPADTDTDNDGSPDGAYADITNDGYLDEFDIFVNYYDRNHDARVTLSTALTRGTIAENQSPEFTADDDLALLVDSASPDRNRNGVSGFTDSNRNGRWDAGETMADVRNNRNADQVLGWRDGFIDRKDNYSKVRGRLVFKVGQQAWQAANSGYQSQLRGPILPDRGKTAQKFSASDRDLPPIDASSFTNTQSPLKLAADGDTFERQVAVQIGVATSQLPTYIESNADSTAPRFWRSDLDDSVVYSRTGRHLWERMPFNSPSYVDFYYRPRYENMTFRNVQIPQGNNGLFINCKFIGVTYVRSYVDNTHTNWQNYGKMQWNDTSGRPVEVTDPLDKSDFLRYTSGNIIDGPANYAAFPDPPVINNQTRTGAERNTKLYSNNIRFHDCLFVGSMVSDTPASYAHVRNKMQFTGSTRFSQTNPDNPDDPTLNPDADDMEEIEKSSLMLPNYSVDVGSFNSPTDTYTGDNAPTGQNMQLKGTIVAGVLDARGNTSIEGTLMMTFAPTAGQGPLQENGVAVGNPANFNISLGYFGPEDGDGESLDPETLPIVNGRRITGYDLDGDGIADKPHDYTPTADELAAGAAAVPFYGYGRIDLKWNPDLPMPDGIMLPLSITPTRLTYKEGK